MTDKPQTDAEREYDKVVAAIEQSEHGRLAEPEPQAWLLGPKQLAAVKAALGRDVSPLSDQNANVD